MQSSETVQFLMKGEESCYRRNRESKIKEVPGRTFQPRSFNGKGCDLRAPLLAVVYFWEKGRLDVGLEIGTRSKAQSSGFLELG